ncbi:SDR family oxidoreductase [Deinococcus misasensis]|uniref:SDR family oxidoreductase n=1 Tax=Deinococcus misasensis TaxID=392413 RepID=UPI0005589DF5|nr:SDR family oxidoreductase [Deinococcus misasensis]
MIFISAATSQLGQHTIKTLLNKGIPASNIVAGIRDPQKAQSLKDLGLELRTFDYQQPETLEAALQGVKKFLLISSGSFDNRQQQHLNAIQAAQKAGVKHIVYTSILNAGDMALAADHKATEQHLLDSGLTYTLLRNGWYNENYAGSIQQVAQTGALYGSAGAGKISAASRQDFAEAAATVLSTSGHENTTYELGGTESFTLSELAAEISKQTGKEVTYNDLPQAEYQKLLEQVGLPAPLAFVFADSDTGISRGELFTERTDLQDLIGRKTTPIAETVALVLG